MVDLLRAVSIGVVVLWHWSLSITHWRDGALTMPNPVGDVPGLWAATWLLQVMPVFFFVGGYANLAGWQAVGRDGDGATGRFLRSRMRRLLGPLVPWLGCWLVADLAWRAAGGRSVVAWGMVVFVPLWFLARVRGRGAGRAGDRPAARPLAVAGAGRAGRGGAGGRRPAPRRSRSAGPSSGWPVRPACGCSATSSATSGGTGRYWPAGRRRAGALVAAGLGGLVVLTALGPYPAAMVAVRGGGTSNMFPTTACIAALATFQLGVVLWLRPRLDAWLQRRAAWRAVVAANGLAMPVFCWHMTALVAFLWLYERAGFTLAAEPTDRLVAHPPGVGRRPRARPRCRPLEVSGARSVPWPRPGPPPAAPAANLRAMSSRYRLVALVGLVLLGAAVYAIFALMRDDTPAPNAAVEAYLADWSDGDFAAMEERVVDPPATFVDDYQAVVDDLGVTEADYELTSVDVGGSTGVARYSAAVELEGLGEWTWDGSLSIAEQDGDWLVEWAPSNIHPDLADGQHLALTREVPERAPILDAAGNPLSVGRPARIIGLEPRAIVDLNQVKAAFQQQLGIDPAAHRRRRSTPPASSPTTSSPSPPSTRPATTRWRRSSTRCPAPGSATRSCGAGPPPSSPPT